MCLRTMVFLGLFFGVLLQFCEKHLLSLFFYMSRLYNDHSYCVVLPPLALRCFFFFYLLVLCDSMTVIHKMHCTRLHQWDFNIALICIAKVCSLSKTSSNDIVFRNFLLKELCLIVQQVASHDIL